MNRAFTDAFPNVAQVEVLLCVRDGAVTDPELAIASAGSVSVKTSAFTYRCSGKLRAKAAQDTIALTNLGTIAAGKTSAVFLSINTSGDVAVASVLAGSDGTITTPVPDDGYCLFGAVTVTAASNAAFTGGTTALDASGVTVAYEALSGTVPGEAL